MSWTYSGDPAASSRDAVRFHVGDTDPAWPMVKNEEIAYALTQQPNVLLAAALVCDAIAAALIRQKEAAAVRGVALNIQRSDAYVAKAATLRQQAITSGAPSFFAGGLTMSGKEALTSDSSAVQPSFSIGQDDLPENATNSTTR